MKKQNILIKNRKAFYNYEITDIRDGFSDEDLKLKVPKGTCVIEPLPISVFEDGTTEYKHNHRKKKQTFIPFIGISKDIFKQKNEEDIKEI